MLNATTVKSNFEAKYIQLSDDWLEQCLEWVQEEYPNVSETESLTLIYQEWLTLDLRDVNVPILPPRITEEIEKTINEIFHLQLLYVVDISKPKYLQLKSIRSKFDDHTEDVESSGMLKLQLTDGIQEISAFEYKKIPGLRLNLEPGLKIRFKPPVIIRRGQILLDHNMIEILGGHVPEIAVINCVENILAAALKQPLNNNPRNGVEKVEIKPEQDTQRSEPVSSNIVNNNTREPQINRASSSNRANYDSEHVFDDILTDEFFNNQLGSFEVKENKNTNRIENDRLEPQVGEIFEDHYEDAFDAELMDNREEFAPFLLNNDNLYPSEENRPVQPAPPTPTVAVTQASRIIMKIAKLNQIKHKIPKGMFNIEMDIVSITKKLKVEDGRYRMGVIAADDSGEIEVQMGNNVMKEILEMEPEDFADLIANGNQNEFSSVMNRLTEKLNIFYAHVVLNIEKDKDPVVTEVLEMFEVDTDATSN